MKNNQAGILQAVPRLAKYLIFSLRSTAVANETIELLTTQLAPVVDGDAAVVGFGHSLVQHVGADVQGLHAFPDFNMNGINIPSTSVELCCWLRGDDQGELLHLSRKIKKF